MHHQYCSFLNVKHANRKERMCSFDCYNPSTKPPLMSNQTKEIENWMLDNRRLRKYIFSREIHWKHIKSWHRSFPKRGSNVPIVGFTAKVLHEPLCLFSGCSKKRYLLGKMRNSLGEKFLEHIKLLRNLLLKINKIRFNSA